MSLRILVVDDHEGWTRHISSQLQNDLRYRVIGEIADGPEAVRATEAAKPDLVVLDIGLPTLNGIEVARRILASVPETRILFVTEQVSPDIAEAALRTGGHGYVIKSDAGGDLLPAIASVADGKIFVSSKLRQRLSPLTGVRRPHEALRHHDVLFSLNELLLAEAYARFVEEVLTSGGSAIVVAAAARRSAVTEKVQAYGVNIDEAVAQGRYFSLDTEETLSSFMVKRWPDEARFTRAAADLVRTAAAASLRAHPRVAACGDCAAHLLKQGHADAAIRLEQLWDEFAAKSGMDILCGYALERSTDSEGFIDSISTTHSAMLWR